MHFVLLGIEVAEELTNAVNLFAAFEDQVLLFLREIGKRDIKTNECCGLLLEIAIPVFTAGFGPRIHRAFIQGKATVGNNQIRRKINRIAVETWRRSRKAPTNPCSYLHTLCISLVVPDWYVSYDERIALVEISRQRVYHPHLLAIVPNLIDRRR